MDVLLTDGNERATLAAARSLVQAGYSVAVTADRRFSLAGVSSGVRRVRVSTGPLADPVAYATEVGAAARRLRARAVLPVTDASVEALLGHRDALPKDIVLPLPDRSTYRKASDKAVMLDVARRAGLAVPETIVLQSPDESLPAVSFFPAVVKPHRSVALGRHFDVSFVASVDSCRAALRALPRSAFPVLLQRRVRGTGEGLFVLRWNGRIIAEFAHRRLREKPPQGGVSVYRESIAIDPALSAAGRRLLKELNWQGVAMIECKRDEAGRHVFMEVNGRLWGSLQLAIDAGVDFPALLVACALGRKVRPKMANYRIGVRSRWFWGDVDHLYLQLRNGGGASGKLRALRAFFQHKPGRDREEIWRWRDPAPFVLQSLQQFGIGR